MWQMEALATTQIFRIFKIFCSYPVIYILKFLNISIKIKGNKQKEIYLWYLHAFLLNKK